VSLPSTTRIALLRGINVGTAKRVAMADLRALFEDLGYGDVRTLLNSGNVVFTAPAAATGDPAARIQKALLAHTGVRARVLTRTAAELERVVGKNPLLGVATNPSRHLAAFLHGSVEQARLKPLLSADWGDERIASGPGVAYLWYPRGILESALGKALDRALGDGVTARNWATTLKILTLTRTP